MLNQKKQNRDQPTLENFIITIFHGKVLSEKEIKLLPKKVQEILL
jgi:hypothetical protein